MKSRCCLIRSFKSTSLSYRIHCYCARSLCSLLSKRHKNSKKDSSIVVWGTVSSACGLVSAVSYLWLYRFRSRKKQCVNSLYSFLDFLRTVPFFYPFPYKTCAYKRTNLVATGTHFYPSRSASFDVSGTGLKCPAARNFQKISTESHFQTSWKYLMFS